MPVSFIDPPGVQVLSKGTALLRFAGVAFDGSGRWYCQLALAVASPGSGKGWGRVLGCATRQRRPGVRLWAVHGGHYLMRPVSASETGAASSIKESERA